MAADQLDAAAAAVDPWEQAYRDLGYAWCRPCAEWHRPPECWITDRGVSALDVALDGGRDGD